VNERQLAKSFLFLSFCELHVISFAAGRMRDFEFADVAIKGLRGCIAELECIMLPGTPDPETIDKNMLWQLWRQPSQKIGHLHDVTKKVITS
jgi:hypothetical protein